jgi:uncharacterized membrane protein YfcA
LAFLIVVAVVAALAGGIASIAGFGIGSLLTPLVASQYGMKTAVGAVAIPHFMATVLRFWRLRSDVDWRVFLGFGLKNATGSLAGALRAASELQARLECNHPRRVVPAQPDA